jgi:hypothetical protein
MTYAAITTIIMIALLLYAGARNLDRMDFEDVMFDGIIIIVLSIGWPVAITLAGLYGVIYGVMLIGNGIAHALRKP